MANAADPSSSESSITKPRDDTESIKVVVRCRPPSQKEISLGHESVVEVDTNQGIVELVSANPEDTKPKRSFTFEKVYDRFSTQHDMYEGTFRDIVSSVLEGYSGTIFAYGQTGAGKTFTMQGVHDIPNFPDLKGVIPRSVDHIFEQIVQSENQQYLVRVSYLQIYQEEINDLLKWENGKALAIKEDPDRGVYVKDLSSYVIKNTAEMERVLKKGNSTTAVWATNFGSVRINMVNYIFTVTVEHTEVIDTGETHIRVGQLNFVDMAGSERMKVATASDVMVKEGASIGISLSPFGQVISALTDGKSTHIPYRNSKLTRLLKDSLGGTAKAIMVACIGPASCNFEETLHTLRYASRVKGVKNRPKINVDPKSSVLQDYLKEIERLKTQLSSPTLPQKTLAEIMKNQAKEDKDDASAGDSDTEKTLQEQKEKLEDQKLAIFGNENLPQEEKDRLSSELQERLDAILNKETETRDALSAKIQKLEAGLLPTRSNTVHNNGEPPTASNDKQPLTEA